MSARLRAIAKETEQIVDAGWYPAPGGGRVEIAAAVARAAAGTELFGPGPAALPDGAAPAGPPRVEVTGESSLDAARRLTAAGGGPVAVLNFASARNPGGGFLNGAQAQEEALCRSSALYACLLRAPEFYAAHRADRDPFYSDRVIHSPAVPVFRDDRGTLLAAPYEVGFLTSAAPNAGVVARRSPERTVELPAVLHRRAERVLRVASAAGCRRLVLGAWGCGVFRNDPAQVAAAFRALLGPGGPFARRVDEVVFGVLDRQDPSPTRNAFASEFASL
ncbi:TIGR02452 family protein [Streptomyces johnsoniae]|uniref:TIGR02452 family protein n=1 Tax=Streptomyces johnsoniae TaxID=3075532 RepID=A0ABU2S245_9ACTN|nr:TIGR02452 family protein [Streptomyces sp. DSM 41886]MDT0442848.1 TIGR02452 family protein [Streptomyces sp. DSM 41886]